MKFFTIPIFNGEEQAGELNKLLRSNKVLSVEKQFVNMEQGVFWCICVNYLEGTGRVENRGSKKEKIDYKETLDEDSFKRFTKMREIRKKIAEEEGIPAYAVFTNNELAAIAKLGTDFSLNDLKRDGWDWRKKGKKVWRTIPFR